MVRFSLRRPITILVLFMSILIFSVVAIRTIPIDIFPKLNSPTIYVIEQYGGMSAQQMEGFFATRMQDQFLYINGIKNVESRNIQGLALIKLSFYESTDMAEASAQVALQVNRTMAFFPPGALPPQVIRFDASSLPVGELVFSSKTRSLKEIFDLALTRIRPLFATVPGMSSAPPFGSNARTVVINVTPEKLKMYNLSADEVVEALTKNNSISPAGNLRVDSTMFITTINTLESTVERFEEIPVKSNGATNILIRDIGNVSDGADITVDYALVNGKRSVYIPVVKTADASTWDVVQTLRSKLPEMQSLLPDDVKLSYEFDQSVFVINSAKSLMTEGILGAILTGLMVLLFLRDWRSSVVVIITIPVAVLGAVFFLKLAGQTINIMTLSGLALAIGILVDQATVTIENIHQYLEMGKSKKRAIEEACTEISFPLVLILLCILAVFAPAFVMTGVPKAMFLPLSLSIAFAMIISFLAAQSLVPVISVWLLKAEKFQYHHTGQHAHAGLALDASEIDEVNTHGMQEVSHENENNFFQKMKSGLMKRLQTWIPFRKWIVIFYLIIIGSAAGICFACIGKDLLPKTNNGQLQLRLREPQGTRLEITEQLTKNVLSMIDSITDQHVSISSAYVGLVPSSFGSSNLYIFNSGTQESVIQVNLDEDYKIKMEELKEKIRNQLHGLYPGLLISFEPIELTEKIMAQGASTPIEVRVAGKSMTDIRNYATELMEKLKKIDFLRDVQIAQPLNMPTLQIHIDRNRLALMGLSLEMVAKTVTDVTSSSRFTNKNLWLDTKNAYTYQTQVEVPEYNMNSVQQLQSVPVVKGQMRPVLSDIAEVSMDSLPGEYDRSGPRRYVTVSANIYHRDLGSATAAIQRVMKTMDSPPAGLISEIRGTSSLLTETFQSLQNGLIAAIVIILLLLAANYQSFGLAIAVLATIPAVILGAMLVLLLTGSTLNLQSYMGIIMSTGVSVANAILIVTNAESLRLDYKNPFKAAYTSAGIRLRPILMTSLAMIAGMIPMASGLGEAGDQSAPLGRAVIGGLVASTLAALFIVPLVYAWIQQKKSFKTNSLLSEDEHK
jgi:multidrug efflux pump subunit AcrB